MGAVCEPALGYIEIENGMFGIDVMHAAWMRNLRPLLRRFMENPLVTGAPHIRFYAGAPLVTSNGMRLGSLCVIDKEPRHLDAEQLMVLANFAEVVVREIEKDIARVSPLFLCQIHFTASLRASHLRSWHHLFWAPLSTGSE